MMTFFILLSIYYFIKDSFNYKKYFWYANVAFGFAISSKLQAITFYPFLFFYIFYENFNLRNIDHVKLKITLLLKSFALTVFIFLITNPYILHPLGFEAWVVDFISNMKSNDISKLIYRKEPAKDERTTSIKDYEYAKNQGFTGTFAQWEQQNRAAGAARFVMPSEGERQDTYNLNRIISAQKRIRDAVEKDPTAIAPSGKEAFVSAIPGAAEYSYLSQGPQRQVVSAAQSEIIDAVLTLATGLSYTPVQLEAQRAAYLPKWNESPESRAAKYQAIRSLVDSAKVRAGRAWTSEMDNAIEEAFAPIAPKSTEPTPFTSAQQRRLDELERKAMQRGTGGPR
ncbi:MAG: hypothetical protein EBY38_07655 [Flavobacteriaceae bacterium]|nr:hypothetical protein [Flavobacteriaceae bacterium]